MLESTRLPCTGAFSSSRGIKPKTCDGSRFGRSSGSASTADMRAIDARRASVYTEAAEAKLRNDKVVLLCNSVPDRSQPRLGQQPRLDWSNARKLVVYTLTSVPQYRFLKIVREGNVSARRHHV